MQLTSATSALVVIDIQERLLPTIPDGSTVITESCRLVDAARLFNVPVLATEQYPKGLGHSVPEIRRHAEKAVFFAKTHFSCLKDPALGAALTQDRQARPMILLCGVEAHVCVLQTALDLHAAGFTVFAATDACGSRKTESAAHAARRMTAEGVRTVTTEMALFEWLGQAGTPAFRKLAPLLK